jgi:hypothetical protein
MTVTTGYTDHGMRCARAGVYRIVAYMDGPGYCAQQWFKDQWYLFPSGERMPRDIEAALCAALNIPVQGEP